MKKILVIELDSTDIKIYDINNQKIYTEKNYIAYKVKYDYSNVHVESKEFYSFGDEAFEYFERTPKDIEVVQCIKNNRIVDINEQSVLISKFLKKYNLLNSFTTTKVYILTSKIITNFEKDILRKSVNLKNTELLYEEDLITNFDEVKELRDAIIVKIDRDNSVVIATHNGEAIFIKKIEFNAYKLDEAVQSYIKYNYKVNISLKSAAKARKELGIINIKGNSIVLPAIEIKSGLPTKFKLIDKLIQHIYKKSVRKLIDEVSTLLKRLPCEYVTGCLSAPMFFTGALAEDNALIKIIARRFNTDYKILNLDNYFLSDKNILKIGDKNAKKVKKEKK